jgi:hypothetical protein
MSSLIVVKRVAILEEGAFGVMLMLGTPFAVTLERTFDDGQPVIPAGRYVCKRSYFYGGGYETYEISVPGHSRVLFHKGNTEVDSAGCILIAESFGVLGGEAGILDSRGGFSEFVSRVNGVGEFQLSVVDA